MKRWNIVMPDYALKLYYKDFETAALRNPEAIDISESFDYGYLEFVNKIKAAAAEVLYDYKGRRIYKIPHNSAYILVRLLCGMEDGEEYYYDGCEFQRHDEHGFPMPIAWIISDPKEFYEQFLDITPHLEMPVEIISVSTLKSLKPIKFYNKDNKAFYRDNNGYYYYADKHDLPKKKDKEEYEKFKDNKNALLVSISKSTGAESSKWFVSEEEFLQECEQYKAETPASYGTPIYNIRKHGYTKKAPDDRAVVFRLPHFQLDKELSYERQQSQSPELLSYRVALKWCGMFEGHKQFGEPFSNMEWVVDLILRWCEYVELKESLKEA